MIFAIWGSSSVLFVGRQASCLPAGCLGSSCGRWPAFQDPVCKKVLCARPRRRGTLTSERRPSPGPGAGRVRRWSSPLQDIDDRVGFLLGRDHGNGLVHVRIEFRASSRAISSNLLRSRACESWRSVACTPSRGLLGAALAGGLHPARAGFQAVFTGRLSAKPSHGETCGPADSSSARRRVFSASAFGAKEGVADLGVAGFQLGQPLFHAELLSGLGHFPVSWLGAFCSSQRCPGLGEKEARSRNQ